MLDRPTLIRGALVGVLLVALAVLADGMARAELERAVGGFAGRPIPAVRVAGAAD